MIRSHAHKIDIWLRDVCDSKTYDRAEDFDEQIFWTPWQAPRLLIMKPARYQPYDHSAVWERLDPEATRNLRRAFVDDYVIRLESLVDKVAGQRAVELAKNPSDEFSAAAFAAFRWAIGSVPVAKSLRASLWRSLASDRGTSG